MKNGLGGGAVFKDLGNFSDDSLLGVSGHVTVLVVKDNGLTCYTLGQRHCDIMILKEE